MKQLSLKGRVFPSDLNHQGSVFGGWLMSKMDKACSIAVESIIRGRAVTVQVSEINFKKPVYNGNVYVIYTEIVKLGKTSLTIDVDVRVIDNITNVEKEVTSAQFKFVAVDEGGSSIPLLAVVRPDIPDYVHELLKSDI